MEIRDLESSLDALPSELLPDGTSFRPWSAQVFRYWISDYPPPSWAWADFALRHKATGLRPVYLRGDDDEPTEPWVEGNLGRFRMHGPEEYDADAVLAELWAENTAVPPGDGPEEIAEMEAETAPFGRSWPGLAPGLALGPADARRADEVAGDLAGRIVNTTDTRLGLVPVARGADIPAYTGWAGAPDQPHPGALSAMLRSWEDRFGVRVIRIGANSLVLSVGAPPGTEAEALPNVSYGAGALRGYAPELVGVPHWSFWWEPFS